MSTYNSTNTTNFVDNHTDFYRGLLDKVQDYLHLIEDRNDDITLMIKYGNEKYHNRHALKDDAEYGRHLEILLQNMQDEVLLFDNRAKRAEVLEYLREKVKEIAQASIEHDHALESAEHYDEKHFISNRIKAINKFTDFVLRLVAAFEDYGKPIHDFTTTNDKMPREMAYGHYVGEIITYTINGSTFVGQLSHFYSAIEKYRAHWCVNLDLNSPNGGAVAFVDGRIVLHGRDGAESVSGIWRSARIYSQE